jgi:hypothetical protein
VSETLDRIRNLVSRGEVISSVHGFRELAVDDILLDEVTDGVTTAIVIEEYPETFKGPSVLVLQQDRTGKPLHVVWGIPKDELGPATIITAYRPNPTRWSADLMRRR